MGQHIVDNLTHVQGSTPILVAQIGVALIGTISSSKVPDMSFHKLSFILESAADILRV